MSYEQAMKHTNNHRKDRFRQPIVMGNFGPEKPLYEYYCPTCRRCARTYDKNLDTCKYCGDQIDSKTNIGGPENEE